MKTQNLFRIALTFPFLMGSLAHAQAVIAPEINYNTQVLNFPTGQSVVQESQLNNQDKARLMNLQAQCDTNENRAVRAPFLNMTTLAQQEARSFAGHTINRDGNFDVFGKVEMDVARVTDGNQRSLPYLMVVKYWQNLDRFLQSRTGESVLSAPYYDYDDAGNPPQGKRLSKAFLDDLKTLRNTQAVTAIQQSLLRAAVADTPWSAAFISYAVAVGAQLNYQTQFQYSIRHSDYINQAIRTASSSRATQYAYRPCNPFLTKIRAGDLICFARYAGANLTFDELVTSVLRGNLQMYESHCDIVTAVTADTVTSIGGNVVDSIAIRRMQLNANGELSEVYRPANISQQGLLNRKNWMVLLQSK